MLKAKVDETRWIWATSGDGRAEEEEERKEMTSERQTKSDAADDRAKHPLSILATVRLCTMAPNHLLRRLLHIR